MPFRLTRLFTCYNAVMCGAYGLSVKDAKQVYEQTPQSVRQNSRQEQ